MENGQKTLNDLFDGKKSLKYQNIRGLMPGGKNNSLISLMTLKIKN